MKGSFTAYIVQEVLGLEKTAQKFSRSKCKYLKWALHFLMLKAVIIQECNCPL